MKIKKNKTFILALALILGINSIAFATGGSTINDEDNTERDTEVTEVTEDKEIIIDINEGENITDDTEFTGGTMDDVITGGDFEYESEEDPIIFDYNYNDPILPSENKPVYNSEPFEFFRADNSNSVFTYSEGDPFDDIQAIDEEPGSKFIKTKKTLQYTKDLEEYPIFIDTGIEVDDEDKISMDGYIEFFRQIAIKGNGKVIEDEFQTMLLVDGNIILAKDGETSVSELKDLFIESGIILEAQNSRMGGRFDLVEKLERSKKLPIIINNVEITQTAKPLIQDNKVLLPIRDIAEGLGAKVEWNKDKGIAKITKNEKTLTFERNSDIIKVDGKEFLISTPTAIRSAENRILSVIRAMVTEFDSEMYYDAHKQALVIETPELENIDNDW